MDTTTDNDTTVGSRNGRFPRYLFLALFLPAAVLVFVLGSYFSSQRVDTRIDEILDYDSTRLNLISGFLGAELSGSLKHLRSLATEAITTLALDSRSPENLQSLQYSFLTLARRNPQYQQIRWIDESGVEMSRVTRKEAELYVVAPQDLQDKSDRYYFKAANALLRGELYISRVDLNIERGQIEMPIRPILRVATPVEDSSQKRRGIIVINIDMEHLFSLVRTPAKSTMKADYLLVNQQGVVLNGDIESFQAADAQDQNADFILPNEKVLEGISASDSGSLELQDGLWTWKKLSSVAAFSRLTRMFPKHLVAFDQFISDDFSLTLVAYRPLSAIMDVRRENRLLIFLAMFFALSVYGLSLFFYLSGRARARRSEMEAAHAMAYASNLAHMKELEERFHRLVDASSIGQLVVDSDGRIEISNLAAERMLGYERGELEGVLVDSLLPAGLQEKHVHYREQFMRAPEARMMGTGRELGAVKKEGSTIPVEIGLTPYSDQDRQLVLVSIIDLSHRNGIPAIV
ncbi:MAG: PAS domain S-box protein [Gammaproteobacteria bacterium]